MKSFSFLNSLFLQFSTNLPPFGFFPLSLELPSLAFLTLLFSLFSVPSYSHHLMSCSSVSDMEISGVCISTMLFIVILNFVGLLPFHLPLTASVSMIVPMALPFIVITFMYVFFMLEDLMCHFTPSGTPSILLSAINMIEGISLGVRWLTLTGRIVGNITCSHCLMCLLETPSIFIVSVVVLLIMHLEFMVCIIQGVVPYILFYSYLSESK